MFSGVLCQIAGHATLRERFVIRENEAVDTLVAEVAANRRLTLGRDPVLAELLYARKRCAGTAAVDRLGIHELVLGRRRDEVQELLHERGGWIWVQEHALSALFR